MLNIIDCIFISIVIFCAFKGGYRGILSQMRSFIPLITSVLVFFLVPILMPLLFSSSQSVLPYWVISLLIAIILYPFWNAVFFSLQLGLKMTSLTVLDRVLGAMIGLAQGVLYISLIVLCLSITPLSVDKMLQKSRIYSCVLYYIDMLPVQYLWNRLQNKTQTFWPNISKWSSFAF